MRECRRTTASRSELWLATGFATYHFQSDKDLNGSNPGVGIEYRFSDVAAVTAGRFYNSDRQHSNYAGVYYQPWASGGVKLGAVVRRVRRLSEHARWRLVPGPDSGRDLRVQAGGRQRGGDPDVQEPPARRDLGQLKFRLF